MNSLEQTPVKQEVQMLYIPEEITQDIDTNTNMAHFDYYTGIRYAELLGLKQTTNMVDLHDNNHFIVCCGDVMLKVSQSDYPEITRRIF